MNCIFCKIANNEIPANIVYSDEAVLAFTDANPQAPHHILVVPKKHIATLNDLEAGDTEVIGKLVQTAKLLAKQLKIADDGYRVVLNCNARAGQTVFHVHLHLLGGRQFTWPPG